MTIKYTARKYAPRPDFVTTRFGNLLSDTYQGEVEQGSDGLWAGWFFNLSNETKNKFRLGFTSRAAAARWVNKRLREAGVG